MTTAPTPTPISQRPQLLRGKARVLELAVEAEQEREAEAAKLLADLGRPASHAEHVIIEQLSTLIVRGRRLRQAGRGADAEMIARLVIRGMTRLGIRQGAAKPRETPAEYLERTAREAASGRAACGGSGQTDKNYLDGDERMGGLPNGEATA